jgi:hypothetical protein
VHWLEVQLVDDETGEPVRSARLRVRLPDGKESNYTTDGQGRVRVEDVPEGTWNISRMEHDEVLEVVALTEG